MAAPTGTVPSTWSTTTVAALILAVRRKLDDNPLTDFLTNAGGINASATSFTIGTALDYVEGDVLDFLDANPGEQMRVSASSSSTTVTVANGRGWNGTTAAVHAQYAKFVKLPRWTQDQINDAITRVVDNLWPYAWVPKYFTFTPDVATTVLNEVPNDLIDLISVYQPTASTPTDIYRYNNGHGGLRADLVQVPVTVNANGKGLRTLTVYSSTNDIEVMYRAKPTTSTIESTLMADTVIYGVCSELLGAKLSPRTAPDVELEAAEAGTTDMLRAALDFERRYVEKRNHLNAFLKNLYPREKVWLR